VAPEQTVLPPNNNDLPLTGDGSPRGRTPEGASGALLSDRTTDKAHGIAGYPGPARTNEYGEGADGRTGPPPEISASQDPQAENNLQLPVPVFGIVEVRRLKRELEALEEYMLQGNIREPGKQTSLPRVSRLLEALATDNGRNLLQPTHRQELKTFLEDTEHSAPTIHISFASDPSSAFTGRLVKWLRANIHPVILLQTGLQPTIAAGCVVRTANHSFDFSLRQRFTGQRALLLQALEAQAPVVAPSAPAAQQPAEVPAA
jgi:hypothetical protein